MSRRRERKQAKRADKPVESRWHRHRWKVGGGVGGAIAAVVMVLLLLPGISPLFLPESSEPPPFDFGSGEGAPLIYEPEWNACLEDWRPNYGLDCDQQRQVFGLLPKAPRDLSDRAEQTFFNEISLERLIRESPGTQAAEYWMQPEFWPAWNESRLRQVLWPPEPQWTVFGYKFYTVGKGLTIGQDALSLGYAEMRILLRPHWGADLWQGFHLYPAYPAMAMKQNGKPMCLVDEVRNEEGDLVCPSREQEIRQDPDEVPFRVTIETPSDSLYLGMLRNGVADDDRREGGQFYVLPPNHPSFLADWARMLTLRITFTLPDPQPGVWFFALYTDDPSAEVDEEYSFHYGLYYESAGRWPVSPIAPLFQGFVVV